MYNEKTVLITGGTGYLGKALIQYFLRTDVKKLIIFSRDEYKQSELRKNYTDDRLRYFIGDIRDIDRLYMAFKNVDIVINCAAMKRIEVCEFDPLEAIKTNVNAVGNIIQASIECGVEKVLNVSTDKAVNPSCLYGSTKQLAEKLIVDGNNYSGGYTKLSNIRCGNFAGSTGSIIPYFLELQKKGITEYPITDVRMTRYWMDISEVIELIELALSDMSGREIYTKDLWSFRVTDLIKAFDATYYEIGKKNGEKFDEQMIDINENTIQIKEQFYKIVPEKGTGTKNIEKVSRVNYFLTVSDIKEKLRNI